MRLHEEQSVATRGELLNNATAAMIIIHGRGGTNHQALDLVDHIGVEGFAYLAPQAANMTWYPHRFIAPRQQNEPGITSGLNVIYGLVEQAISAGIPAKKIMFLGFSQGACLAGEYVARNPQRFGGAMILSGGLIGTDAELVGYSGSLDGTPIFLGCSDIDSHIPLQRVHQSTVIFKELGASVDERIYPGMGHTINAEEIDAVRSYMQQVVAS
jgi:predicted esterase